MNIELNSKQISYDKGSGCGNYQGAYRLNGKWILNSFDGEELEGIQKLPSLNLTLDGNRFFGFDGCNRIFGQISFSENQIYFDYSTSNTKTCSTTSFASIFNRTLDNKTLSFQLLSDEIGILSNNEIELEFMREK
ncbi:MAG: hypothetical protein ACJAWV_000886 [Flammeovirgaceae bacterium]